jgi:predicted TIM-barrel fold metal-dependent hydrolase
VSYSFFDSLMHVKVDPKWYKTEKMASSKLISAFYHSGDIQGAVIACMPDDDPKLIANIINSELPFCKLVISIKNEWLHFSEIELSKLFRKFKIEFHCVGIKIHPRFSMVSLNDESVIDRIISTAHSCGLMVYVCTILRHPFGPNSQQLHYQIARIAERNICGDIVFLHGGYTDVFSTGEIIRDYPHAWLDLSFTFMRFRKSSLALDCGYLMETLDRKVLIGTDFPECTPKELFCALENYVFSRSDLELTDQKINNVLFGNIKSLISKYEAYD